jgi:hypothetical protein
MISPRLGALETKIAAALAARPECFITHPAEVAVLKEMTPDELEKFALDHGWGAVRRLGGRQIQFYNDAAARTDL